MCVAIFNLTLIRSIDKRKITLTMLGSRVSTAAILASVVAAKGCHNITVPLTLESRNAVFGNMATPYTALVSQYSSMLNGTFTDDEKGRGMLIQGTPLAIHAY